MRAAPFFPECLTVGLGDSCNLACAYCFSRPADGPRAEEGPPAPDTLIEAVRAAARLVAAACGALGKPVHFGIQGGGEPSASFAACRAVVEAVSDVCSDARVPLLGYTSTNGVMTEERARWFAQHFSWISLSVDGPPPIHDRLRPLRGGGGSAARLAGTAAILRAEGRRLQSRTTVTGLNVAWMVATVEFVSERLGIREARFEPVYDLGGQGLLHPDADAFVDGFLRARERGRELGCDVGYSGHRPHERHGPYCNVLRDVLCVTRDGRVSACPFESSDCAGTPFDIGQYDPVSKSLALDYERIAALSQAARDNPAACVDCVAAEHCVRGCPDSCPVSAHDGGAPKRPAPGASLRCRINRRLALAGSGPGPCPTSGGAP